MLVPEIFYLERKRLGQMLRLAREEGGFTVREVASISGLDFTHVSKIELGNTNVALEKFARLCCALMIPPGIVLESFIWIGRAEGFLSDPMVIRLTGEHPGRHGLDNEISGFIAGTALALSYTLKSSNPLLMLINMEFAVEPQRDDFLTFARERVFQLTPAARREILFLAMTKGWDYLASIGLLNVPHLNAYLANSKHGKRPWIPIPKTPFFQDELDPVDPIKANVHILVSPLRLKYSKSMLDNAGPLSHTAGVQNEIRDLKGLIARLKKVTAPRGAKAALAREFKVTRQAVNQWLSGESNPSADIAIRLQYWKPKLPEK
jgi:transcriptional regulator with XRE-family HTH domain